MFNGFEMIKNDRFLNHIGKLSLSSVFIHLVYDLVDCLNSYGQHTNPQNPIYATDEPETWLLEYISNWIEGRCCENKCHPYKQKWYDGSCQENDWLFHDD